MTSPPDRPGKPSRVAIDARSGWAAVPGADQAAASDRRLCRRVPGDGTEVTWEPADTARSGNRSWWRRRPGTTDRVVATLEDVSATGARLHVSGGPRLRPGSSVVVGHGDASGTVTVMRVEELADESFHYGVEFGHLDPELRDVLLTALDRQRPSDLEDLWKRSD